MTEELDRWLAESVMGWYLQEQMVMVDTGKEVAGYFDRTGLLYYESDWHPTDPKTGQIWMVVGKMREKGYRLSLNEYWNDKGDWLASFLTLYGKGLKAGEALDPNPALAICKAIKAALEKKNEIKYPQGLPKDVYAKEESK